MRRLTIITQASEARPNGFGRQIRAQPCAPSHHSFIWSSRPGGCGTKSVCSASGITKRLNPLDAMLPSATSRKPLRPTRGTALLAAATEDDLSASNSCALFRWGVHHDISRSCACSFTTGQPRLDVNVNPQPVVSVLGHFRCKILPAISLNSAL